MGQQEYFNVAEPMLKEENGVFFASLSFPCVYINSILSINIFYFIYSVSTSLFLICRKMWTRSSICFPQCLMRMRVYSWMITLECLQVHLTRWIRMILTSRNLIRCTVSAIPLAYLSISVLHNSVFN